ncbi:MAG: hypothetical protein WBX22_24050 [Silvibacterium sp.]|jgi:hypothetical protein
MQHWKSITLLTALLTLSGFSIDAQESGDTQSPRTARAGTVSESVRTFMQTVAREVTQEGPSAWCRHFDTSQAFFMAVNGQMAFPNGTAAQEGTKNFARTISHIELNWGDDLRVDPLTPQFAVVAASWHEVQVDHTGHRVDESGYFTGLAQYHNGSWFFRDAHWSQPVPPQTPSH